jgi:hypothetical protein
MYIENSKGEMKLVGGIKREYPEPRHLDFGLSSENKPEQLRLKTAPSTSYGCTLL